MIMDRITDWIVTAWELIGLLFLSGSTDPALGHGADAGEAQGDTSASAANAGRMAQRLHFA